MHLEHVALNLPEPVDAAQWYANNLKMRIVKKVDEAPFMTFVADSKGGMLEFYSNPNGPVPDYAAMSPYTLHLAFAVDDIEAERDRLLSAGATDAGEIETTPGGDRLLFLRDPWGVPLQLLTRAEPFV